MACGPTGQLHPPSDSLSIPFTLSAPSTPGSLGLISDAFHMVFDCTALLAGLIATVITRWGPNERYTFGYVLALLHKPLSDLAGIPPQGSHTRLAEVR